jgi:hypothetical protein
LPAFVLFVGLCVGGSLTVLAGCQADGPRRHGIRNLHITDVGGYVEFVARDRRRSQESKTDTADARYEETIFEESVKLEFDGYVYHPNFLEFALGGLFGLVQHDYEDKFGDRLRTSQDDGTITEFDMRADFLQKKSYPGSVFARRYRSLEPRPFQPSLEVTTTNYGLVWQYADEKTPTNFQFTHTDVELDPQTDFEEKGRQKNTLLRFETSYHFSTANVLSFVYDFRSIEEEPFDLSYDTNEATISHRWNFGGGHRHRLDSELNYYNQHGTFDIERTRWRELLRFEHSEALRSWLLFEVLDRTQGSLSGVAPIEERSYSLSGTIEHRWYDSLITQLGAYGQRQEFGSGLDINRCGLTADFDYRKMNRWGVLRAGYQFRAQRENRDGGMQQAEVLDERHTFNDPEPIVLSNPNVDVGSIQMTAEDRITFYTIGRDYTIDTIGDRVEIYRVPTGRILNGQVVLVDYTFDIGGNYDLDTINHLFSIRQDYDFGLSPYYRLRHQNQILSPKRATGVTPDDITGHIVGVEFRRGVLDFSVEFEDYDSTVNPFVAVRLDAGYTGRFGGGATGILKAKWSDVSRLEPNERDTRYFSLEGRYRHPITRRFTVEGSVLYHNEDDSLTGRDEGVDVDLSLEWFIRDTEMRVTYEYGQYDDRYADSDYAVLFVQVRRKF